jgi:DNA helicase-2/ATP-dependent DNA helicase PcrA
MNISQKQKEIIDYNDDEDILVIACPGSGKTHTIICKYIKFVTNNIYLPEQIILITFTKKAGNELINRLKDKILNKEPNKEPYYVGTIHGLAYKILKKYNNINYTILDEFDYKNYILNICELNNSTYIIKKNIISIIEQVSNSYPINLMNVLLKNNLEKYYDEFNKIYIIYKEKKIIEKYIDFNDLMILFSNFLENNCKNILDKIKDIDIITNNIDLDKEIKYYIDYWIDKYDINNNNLNLIEDLKIYLKKKINIKKKNLQ